MYIYLRVMAHSSPLSPLLRRCLSSQNPIFLRATGPLFISHAFTTKQFSSLPSAQTDASTNLSDSKPTGLSARMSFVFDQIDAIERERSQKDDTLQRIRAWRESKKSKTNYVHDASVAGVGELKPGELSSVGTELGELEAKEGKEERGGVLNREVELVHPWAEWIELMERLVQQNYFDHRRKDEDKMVEDSGFQMSEVVGEGFDFTRDWKTVQTACLNFGRDRFDILRSVGLVSCEVYNSLKRV